MKTKRFVSAALAAVMLFAALSAGFCAYALVLCETQYSYDSANPSWLKDLTVKEDMSTVGGLSGSCTLEPVASYPYRETAESFSEEIAYYQMLYTLDEDMANAAYLYLLSLAESFASAAVSSGQSDEFIRSYLESAGIVYPEGSAANSPETAIVARALYAVMAADGDYTVTRGTGLYDAFTAYVSKLVGVGNTAILKFDGDGDLSDLKEYVLAACKYVLYSAGYKVDKDTPESEVYRLIAIMTIRAQGISIDSSTATFEEIKNKYLCAMICEIYGVTIDYPSFEKAVKSGKLDFYMLQLIGKKNGVTVKDSVTYDEAFRLVSENTDYFDLEAGEFYADIYEYNIHLKYKRDIIWLYPRTLGTTSESDGTRVSVFVNGNSVRDNYYVDASLDSSKSVNEVTVTVEYRYASGKTVSSSYKLNIYEGKETPVQSTTLSSALAGVSGLAAKVISEIGSNSAIESIASSIPFELPQRFWSIASLMLPSFSGSSAGSDFLRNLFSYSSDDDSRVETNQIGGVGGLDSYNASSDSVQSLTFPAVSVSPGNSQLQVQQEANPAVPANEIIVNNGAQNNPYAAVNNGSGGGNWFKALISDTKTVVVLIIAVAASFAVCFVLFSQIIKERNKNGKTKTKKK